MEGLTKGALVAATARKPLEKGGDRMVIAEASGTVSRLRYFSEEPHLTAPGTLRICLIDVSLTVRMEDPEDPSTFADEIQAAWPASKRRDETWGEAFLEVEFDEGNRHESIELVICIKPNDAASMGEVDGDDVVIEGTPEGRAFTSMIPDDVIAVGERVDDEED